MCERVSCARWEGSARLRRGGRADLAAKLREEEEGQRESGEGRAEVDALIERDCCLRRCLVRSLLRGRRRGGRWSREEGGRTARAWLRRIGSAERVRVASRCAERPCECRSSSRRGGTVREERAGRLISSESESSSPPLGPLTLHTASLAPLERTRLLYRPRRHALHRRPRQRPVLSASARATRRPPPLALARPVPLRLDPVQCALPLDLLPDDLR